MGDVQSDHIRRLIVEYVRLQQEHRATQNKVSSLATERRHIVQQLTRHLGGSQTEVAKLLGISSSMVARILSRGTQSRKLDAEGDSNTNT